MNRFKYIIATELPRLPAFRLKRKYSVAFLPTIRRLRETGLEDSQIETMLTTALKNAKADSLYPGKEFKRMADNLIAAKEQSA